MSSHVFPLVSSATVVRAEELHTVLYSPPRSMTHPIQGLTTAFVRSDVERKYCDKFNTAIKVYVDQLNQIAQIAVNITMMQHVHQISLESFNQGIPLSLYRDSLRYEEMKDYVDSRIQTITTERVTVIHSLVRTLADMQLFREGKGATYEDMQREIREEEAARIHEPVGAGFAAMSIDEPVEAPHPGDDYYALRGLGK